MANYIEAKVAYEKTTENGLQKKVTEQYLVDAMSFTEAEERITSEMSAFISGDFEVSAVKKFKVSEIFFDESDSADRFFKAKLAFITIDEKSLSEKRSNVNYLIQAATFEDAFKRIKSEMGNTMNDYVIVSINETMIMDVYKYQPKEEKKDESEAVL